jgi:hypothetical protein
MSEILMATTIHSTEDGVVLAAEAASVQKEILVEPIQSTTDMQPPTEGEEPDVEKVGAPTLGASEDAAPIALGQAKTRQTDEGMVVEINDSHVDENRVDTVPVSPPSSPARTTAIAVTAGGMQAKTQIRRMHADADKLMLEKTMEKVCESSKRIEAQTTITVERDVGACIVNCEDALRRESRGSWKPKKSMWRSGGC